MQYSSPLEWKRLFLSKHSAIIDKYYLEKKKALVVDEWGIWTAPEPGQPKGWLIRQSSLRDAIICSVYIKYF